MKICEKIEFLKNEISLDFIISTVGDAKIKHGEISDVSIKVWSPDWESSGLLISFYREETSEERIKREKLEQLEKEQTEKYMREKYEAAQKKLKSLYSEKERILESAKIFVSANKHLPVEAFANLVNCFCDDRLKRNLFFNLYHGKDVEKTFNEFGYP